MRVRRSTAGRVSPARTVCPGCGAPAPTGSLFCERCGLPFVPDAPAGADGVSERRRVARKIKPQLSEGPLVGVAHATNLAEAELIQALLLDAGVPSLLRRSAGFDVPDFLAAGPRDVLVAVSGLDVAREALLAAEIVPSGSAALHVTSPSKLLAGLLLAIAAGALVLWLLSLIIR